MGYVILDRGTDYNDEYYSIGGDNCKVEKHGFETIQAAREAVRSKLKDDLRHYEFYSFSEGGYGYEEAFDLYSSWIDTEFENDRYGHRNYDWDFLSTPWSKFVELAEKNGVEWIDKVPEIYTIVEVTFP